MTDHPLPGKTDWESREHRGDHGHRVATALAFHYFGRRIETDPGFPLPDGSEALALAAAADMQAVADARRAAAEAYAAGRLAAIHDAVAEKHAEIYPARVA